MSEGCVEITHMRVFRGLYEREEKYLGRTAVRAFEIVDIGFSYGDGERGASHVSGKIFK